MAEDPKVRAHNEAMRAKREAEEREAQRRHGRKMEEAMRNHGDKMGKIARGDQKESVGCLIVFALLTGAPIASVALRWFA